MKEIQEKTRVGIIIGSTWAYRNWVLSGLLQKLVNRYDLVVILPSASGLSWFQECKALGVSEFYFVANTKHTFLGIRLLLILKKIWTLKGNHTLASIKERKSIKKRKGLNFYLVFYLFELLFERLYFKFNLDFEKLEEIFGKVKLDFLLSTSFVTRIDREMILYFSNRKVPVCSHILSFDNISSRGYLPWRKLDNILIWNQKMRNELILNYRIKESRLHITGTPQFDFYLNENRLSIDDRSKVKFILYCANHIDHTPKEPLLVEAIYQAFQQSQFLSEYKWVIRVHPLDDYSRWSFLSDGRQIDINYPWGKISDTSYVGTIRQGDLNTQCYLFSNSSLTMGVASTVLLDSAINGVPYLNIAVFEPQLGIDYRPLYLSTHYLELLSEFSEIEISYSVSDILNKSEELLRSYHSSQQIHRKIKSYFSNSLGKSVELIEESLEKLIAK